jgi:glycerol-3-phosphate dehydrogenase
MYDLFAGREALESSYFLTRSKALEAFPMLKKDELVGALVYYDGKRTYSSIKTPPDRLNIFFTASFYK